MTVAMKIDFYSYWKLNSLVVKHYFKKMLKFLFSLVLSMCALYYLFKKMIMQLIKNSKIK